MGWHSKYHSAKIDCTMMYHKNNTWQKTYVGLKTKGLEFLVFAVHHFCHVAWSLMIYCHKNSGKFQENPLHTLSVQCTHEYITLSQSTETTEMDNVTVFSLN